MMRPTSKVLNGHIEVKALGEITCTAWFPPPKRNLESSKMGRSEREVPTSSAQYDETIYAHANQKNGKMPLCNGNTPTPKNGKCPKGVQTHVTVHEDPWVPNRVVVAPSATPIKRMADALKWKKYARANKPLKTRIAHDSDTWTSGSHVVWS